MVDHGGFGGSCGITQQRVGCGYGGHISFVGYFLN